MHSPTRALRASCRTTLLAALLAAPTLADGPYEATTPGKASSVGLVPVLTGSGAPTPGSTSNALQVSDAFPGALAFFVAGPSQIAIPFQGGILGPDPIYLLPPQTVDPGGATTLPFSIPAPAAVGVELWAQAWVAELAPVLFLSATNTLKITVLDPVLGDPVFPNQLYPAGVQSYRAVVAELDGDGVPDLAVKGINGTTDVEVLAGVGNGAFCPPVPFAVGVGQELTAADLDGDGDRDLVLESFMDIVVLLNDGAGQFAPGVNHPAGLVLRRPVVADLDGDGTPDVVVPIELEDSIGLLFGNGDGTLAPVIKLAAGSRPRSVAARDLDGDGDVDLAVSNNQSSELWVLAGAGDGTFGPPTVVPLTFPRTVVAEDLDADGAPDLLVDTNSGWMQLAGVGDGTFGAPVASSVTTTSFPALDDLDGDGTLDLAGTNQASEVSVQLGLGGGAFAAPTTYALGGGIGAGAREVYVEDLDGDGTADLAVVTKDGIVRLLGQGGGTFLGVELHDVGDEPRAVALADVDGDGALDLLTANDGSGDVSVLLNAGDGTLGADVPVTLSGAPFGPQSSVLAAGDLNNDGLDDVVVNRLNPYGFSVLLATGGGAFGAESTTTTGSSEPRAMTVADVDGDGNADLLVAEGGVGLQLSVRLGAGDGTLGAPATYNANQSAGNIAVADLDGDGLQDVVVTDASTGVVLLFGTGAGALGAPVSLPTPTPVRFVDAGDLDADGDPDLVASRGFGSDASVYVLLGNGDGSFAAPVHYDAGTIAQTVVIADLTTDGVPDLVVNGQPGLWLLRGQGDGTFASASSYAAPTDVPPEVRMAVGDLDGDGAPEVVVIDATADAALVLRNQL